MFRLQSTCSFRSMTFCTNRSENDVLTPDTTTPKRKGCSEGTDLSFDQSDALVRAVESIFWLGMFFVDNNSVEIYL